MISTTLFSKEYALNVPYATVGTDIFQFFKNDGFFGKF